MENDDSDVVGSPRRKSTGAEKNVSEGEEAEECRDEEKKEQVAEANNGFSVRNRKHAKGTKILSDVVLAESIFSEKCK